MENKVISLPISDEDWNMFKAICSMKGVTLRYQLVLLIKNLMMNETKEMNELNLKVKNLYGINKE